MTHHKLKAAPVFFSGYVGGRKPWSLRNNDRHFQPGDTVEFYEWWGDEETGHRSGVFDILDVWDLTDLPEGHVILSLGPMQRKAVAQQTEECSTFIPACICPEIGTSCETMGCADNCDICHKPESDHVRQAEGGAE